MKVAIDPGHGGEDVGALGAIEGYNEKDYNMEQAEVCDFVFRRRGWEVVWTRVEDVNVNESESADLANRKECDVYVALHANGAAPSAHGFEVLYFHSSEKGLSLAEAVCKHLEKLVGDKVRNRGVHPRYPKSVRGHAPHEYRGATVLGDTRMPAIIMEAGFISNEKDAEALRHLAYQFMVAEAIALAIEEVIV